jgi:hypothetical protein
MQLRQNPNLIVRREEDGKFLAYNRENQLPLVLNGTSHRILDLCDGSRDLKEIQVMVAREFDLDRQGLDEGRVAEIVEDHIILMTKLRLVEM